MEAVRQTGQRSLSADAEFAEDLAIRYADVHFGLHTPYYVSGRTYDAARDRCMQDLFEQVAREHAVSVQQVYGSLGQNRLLIDLAETVPFLLLYCIAAVAITRFTSRKYSPEDYGRVRVGVMVVFLSLLLAAGGTMLAEIWSGLAETYRVGNGHMSYRLQRLLWAQHHTAMFVGLLLLFWVAEVLVAGRFGRINIRTGDDQ